MNAHLEVLWARLTKKGGPGVSLDDQVEAIPTVEAGGEVGDEEAGKLTYGRHPHLGSYEAEKKRRDAAHAKDKP